jgi:hypothetical protein
MAIRLNRNQIQLLKACGCWSAWANHCCTGFDDDGEEIFGDIVDLGKYDRTRHRVIEDYEAEAFAEDARRDGGVAAFPRRYHHNHCSKQKKGR